jgi:hypothetical protein
MDQNVINARVLDAPLHPAGVARWLRPVLLLLAFAGVANAQPAVQNQQGLGGSGTDLAQTLFALPDGRRMVFCTSDSGTTAIKQGSSLGDSDFWMITLSEAGVRLADQTYGGTGADQLSSAVVVTDGGFLLGGNSFSASGGTKGATNYGSSDYWIIRVDTNGIPLWDRSFGGSGVEALYHVERLQDGGFLLTGASTSPDDGNKTTTSVGEYDAWVIRVNASGEILWQRSFGGIYSDYLNVGRELPDGGFLLAGRSDSPVSANKTAANYGFEDVWIVRLDAGGNKLWDRTLGGSNFDYSRDLILLPGGDALLVSASLSGVSGNKQSPNRGNVGSADAWLLRLDPLGNVVWEQTYGGTGIDVLERGMLSDGALLLSGQSFSGPGGNKTSPAYGMGDAWLARIDFSGVLLWEASIGSGGEENAIALAALEPNMGVAVAGRFREINNQAPPVTGFGGDDIYLFTVASDHPQLAITPLPPVPDSFQRFQVTLSGASNLWYRTEYSFNLQTWQPWAIQQMLTPTVQRIDESGAPRRFFRAKLAPSP